MINEGSIELTSVNNTHVLTIQTRGSFAPLGKGLLSAEPIKFYGVGATVNVEIESKGSNNDFATRKDLFSNALTGEGILNITFDVNVPNGFTATYANFDGALTVLQQSALQLLSGTLGDYADDTAAAGGGVIIGGLYRTGNAVQIRLV